MATNSGSGNPLGIEMEPVTGSPPPVDLETLSKIKKLASDEIKPELRSAGSNKQAGNDDVAKKVRKPRKECYGYGGLTRCRS